MGAAIGILCAGSYPDLIKKLILIDGFGAITKSPLNAASILRNAIDCRLNNKIRSQKQYESFDRAVESRLKTVTVLPGSQFLSREAAVALVSRGSKPFNWDVTCSSEVTLQGYQISFS